MPRFLLWLIPALLPLGCDGDHPLAIPGGEVKPRGESSSLADPDGQSGPIRVYSTRPGASAAEPANIARILAGYIEQASQSIDVCAFELDNRVITEALVSAVKRGVRVRLVTETDYFEESGVRSLKAAGVPIVDDRRDGALMHNKFMVFDGRQVWTGSMNFTENCAYRNNNHGVWIDDARIAANYATKFSWMFEQGKFGGAPNRSAKIPHPIVTLNNGVRVENYFSTHDRVAERVKEQVAGARRSLDFLAFSFTHDGIGQAMLQRATAGVPVQGVFERTQTAGGYSEYERLRRAGPPVSVYTDANPRNMHHKVIIIDGEAVVAGSFNFSDSADKQNDENVVIIHDRAIAERFQQEFQRVYGAARAAALP